MFLVSTTVWSATGTVTFNATTAGNTITTNGVSISAAVSLTGVGGTWTLGSAFTNTGIFSAAAGTFSTSASNYALTCGAFSSSNSNVRTINLNGSTITATGGGATSLNFNTTTNLTFNAGTSQFNLSGATSGIASGGLTFYNVSFTSTGASAITITGANTFNILLFTGRTASPANAICTFSANQTIGTLTLNPGTASAYRTSLFSDTIGTQRTLAVTTITAGVADYDFRDIAITGASLTGTRLGDCKGNSGITFPASKTVYFRQTGTSNWGVSGTGAWSATLGGALNATMFPLAQDTATFSGATYPATGSTVTINGPYNIGRLDFSLRTAATLTLVTSNSLSVYENWYSYNGLTLSGTVSITFAGRYTGQYIFSSGRTFTQQIVFNSPGGSVVITSALTTSGSTGVTLTNGTLDLNGYTLTASNGSFTNAAGTKDLTFNGGSLVLGEGFGNPAPTGFTTTAGTGTGVISLTKSSFKAFSGNGSTYNCTLNQGGSGQLYVTGSNTFSNITNTYSATGATSVAFAAGETNIFTAFNLTGASGRVCTLSSITAAQTTLQKGSVWQVGANSTDGGNNSGLSFVAGGGIDYLSISYINGTVSGGGNVYDVDWADTVTAIDAIAALFNAYSALTETATATDNITVTYTTNPTLAETATATDASTAQYTANPSVSETATATDFLAVSAAWAALIAESGTATDAVFESSGEIYFANIDELTSIADVAAARIAASVTVAEIATAVDTPSSFVVFPAAVLEALTATDEARAAQVFVGTLAEAIAASDATGSSFAFYAQVDESAYAADASAVAASIFNAPFEDTIGVIDAVVPSSTYNASVVVVLVATDTVVGTYLWTPVDDNQTANWQNITNTQTSGWTDVLTPQTPGWTDVNT
jgi:hypothetical protein